MIVGLGPRVARAQHEGHSGGDAGGEVEGMGDMPMGHEKPGPLGIPMARHGSGTAWLPDESPMAALHFMARGWRLMLHGNLFAGYAARHRTAATTSSSASTG